ncbi:MAG TPA: type VI secretion system contractile sheath large subunit [Gemmataceae bacterium]|nr:type VI secretion system contractile sheath large subunit [Gemmataceae bacterium]
MAKPWSLRIGDINLTAGTPSPPGVPQEDTPFRIAILGNFSGTRGASSALANRRPIVVDRDNFDEVMAQFNVQVQLPAGEPIRFRELDDFHPDRLFEQLELFETLRDLRRRLGNRSTFAAAAAEVRSWGAPAAPPPAEETAPPPPRDGAQLLDEILGGGLAPAPAPAPGLGGTDWNAFLQQIVAPYAIPGADPDQARLIAQVDEATGAAMRAVLHDPAFQAVEALWRGVYFLVRRLNTDEGLKLCLIDVSKEELAADLGAADLSASATYKMLVERTVGTPGAHPWAALIAHYTLGATVEDAVLLARMGMVARAAGAPFLAAADSRLFGCTSLAQTPDADDWQANVAVEVKEVWAALRQTPQAAWIGLAAPRFLLRLPYGKAAGGMERFAFEELPEGAPHEGYLWGNPSVACALLLGEAFTRAGWGMRPGLVLDVTDLPAHVWNEDGESHLKPCAEVVLSERAYERILDAGVMPLLSVQGSDRVHLARFQSLAEPLAPLAGRWQ